MIDSILYFKTSFDLVVHLIWKLNIDFPMHLPFQDLIIRFITLKISPRVDLSSYKWSCLCPTRAVLHLLGTVVRVWFQPNNTVSIRYINDLLSQNESPQMIPLINTYRTLKNHKISYRPRAHSYGGWDTIFLEPRNVVAYFPIN